MKNNSRILLLVSGIIACVVAVEGSPLPALSKPAIPSTNKNYTVQQLLTLINSNNPNKTSDFIVAVDANDDVIESDGKITNIKKSKSAKMADLTSVIQSNLTTPVKLYADPTLITFLSSKGILNTKIKDQSGQTMANYYSKILLYFVLDGYRFYLNDPNPGNTVRIPVLSQNLQSQWTKISTTSRVNSLSDLNSYLRSPALNIIMKWDFTKNF